MDFAVTPTGSLSETVRALKTHGADIALVGKDALDDGPAGVRDLAAARTGPVIALLSRPEPQDDIASVLQAGAYGYLSLDLTPDELESSITLLIAGDIVVSRDLAADIATSMGTTPDDGPDDRLSQREREVLGLVATGKTNREIAQELIVTESTVKVHLRNVLDKLNLRNRQQAAAYAAREGMLDDAEDQESSVESA